MNQLPELLDFFYLYDYIPSVGFPTDKGGVLCQQQF